MTAELQAMWQTIDHAYPYVRATLEKGTTPSDGMPGTKPDPRKTPCNLAALSWLEMTDRLAIAWAEDRTSPQAARKWLSTHIPDLDPDAMLDYQTETHTIHNGALAHLPAHEKTRALTTEQVAGVHCSTLQEIRLALAALGHQVPLDTIKTWSKRGHLTKTQAGYPLTQALQRATVDHRAESIKKRWSQTLAILEQSEKEDRCNASTAEKNQPPATHPPTLPVLRTNSRPIHQRRAPHNTTPKGKP